MNIMNVNILGLGYVGLTLAITLADIGLKVNGIDKDSKKISNLKQGIATLYEPQIDVMLKSNISSGNIQFSETLQKNNHESCHIICVGTPVDDVSHEPFLENLKNAASEVGKSLRKNDLVIVRSTVPVGTTRNIIKPILEKESGMTTEDFFLANAPERTLQGAALEELRKLSQVIGGINPASVEKAANIFNKVTKTIVRVSSIEAAELIKLFDNTYRDITISIGNLCGKICDELNLNAKEVIESANYGYNRNKILFPGAGVGGGCLVKDPYLLLNSLKNPINLDLIKTARKINDSITDDFNNLIKKGFDELSKNISDSKILILGFAFKGTPQTDDIRFSPTLKVVQFLKEHNADLYGYDPIISKEEINNLGVKCISDFYTNGTYDCIIIMNNNPVYKNLNFKQLENENPPLLVIDGWYLYDSHTLKKQGIRYYAIGFKNNSKSTKS